MMSCLQTLGSCSLSSRESVKTKIRQETDIAFFQSKGCPFWGVLAVRHNFYFDGKHFLFAVWTWVAVGQCLLTGWHLLCKLWATTVICQQPKHLQQGFCSSNPFVTDFTQRHPATITNWSGNTHLSLATVTYWSQDLWN